MLWRSVAVLALALIVTMPICSQEPMNDDCAIYNAIMPLDWRPKAEECLGTTMYVPDETIDIAEVWGMTAYTAEQKYAKLSDSVKTNEEGQLLRDFISLNSHPSKEDCLLLIKPQYERYPRATALRYFNQDPHSTPFALPARGIGFVYMSRVAYNTDHTKAVFSWGYLLCRDCQAMNYLVIVRKDHDGWHLERYLVHQLC